MNSTHSISHHYRPDIDGLRAFAVLAVVGYHAFPGWFKGGFVGVDVFFVISGYLISGIIFDGLDKNEFSFVNFYFRRIRRIFPALVVVIFAFLLIGWWVLLTDEYGRLGKHAAAGVGFISNLVFWKESGYFDSAAISKPFLHLWSLAVEEQFYIVWPIIIWLIYKFRFNIFYLIILIAAGSFTLNIITITTDPIADFFNPLTRFWEILFGAILAFQSRCNNNFSQRKSSLYRDFQSVAGGILLVASCLLIRDKSHFPGWWAILPVLGSYLLIDAGSTAWVNRVILSRNILVWFGLISFPLYLWHWPLLSFSYILENQVPASFIRLIVVVIAIGLAAATYYLIEKPLRHGKAEFFIICILSCLMLLIASAGLFIYKNDGVENREVVKINIRQTDGAIYRQNPAVTCSNSEMYIVVHKLCVKYEAQNSKKNIVLWGDSSASAWLPVFLEVAAKNDISIFHITHLSCPPILDARKTKFNFLESRQYCSDGKTQHEILRFIKDIKPDVTVLIAAWNAYSDYSNREFITDTDSGEANAETTKRVIHQRLPETIGELTKISKTVVFESWPMLAVEPKARKLPFFGLSSREAKVEKEEFQKDVKNIRQVLAQAEHQHQNLVLFDPAKKICLQDACLSVVNGVNYYLDKYHITPIGSMEFAPEIESLLHQ